MTNSNRKSIRFMSAIFSAAAIILLASSSAYAGHSEKVKVCHLPPGNPDNVQSIEVGESAVQAHLAHGDTLGSCAHVDEETEHSESADEAAAGGGTPNAKPIRVYSIRSIQGW
ncbi:hypothetical protein Ga0123462_0667 [Mariprofundus ferrinatatus]|uniref:Uncharacterized protein n=1 Tax=Mariprofundus ferrinatatus TaxID=1921087 RepID=A0A2K8L2L8_9PROT|nr:hypothetical protein [Mariprofundus ferrinatatus]ATX81537.1 hypothetical protein Ga0123462_0667 [Mariprofundus ferrinatatus]